jgi:hypothetical protein
MMEKVSAIGQNSAWEIFRVRAYEAEVDRWVEYRLDTRWPVIQRLEAEVPAAGAPWVFQGPNAEPAEGELRVTMSRGVDGTITWTEERYNSETTQWETRPVIAYSERLGPASQGG